MMYPIPDLQDFIGFNQDVTGMEQECKKGLTGVQTAKGLKSGVPRVYYGVVTGQLE